MRSQDLNRPAPEVYSVAGRFLFIDVSDSRLATLVEQLFTGWLLTRMEYVDQKPDIRITFHIGQSLPEIPRGWDHFEIAEGGQCYSNKDSYYLDLSHSLLFLHQDAAVEVKVWLRNLPDLPDAGIARVTSFAVCAALRRCGLFELHAAGVISPESGKGALIIGGSGSGKSTLTLELAKSGWHYLSDDELLLGNTGEGVEARGFRSFFAVTPEIAVASLPSNLGDSPVQVAAENNTKTCFEPATLFPRTHSQSVIPAVLLFPVISAVDDTKANELTQAETMMRLVRACPWATYDRAIANTNLAVLSRLARQTRAFDLFSGTDLLRPGFAADWLKQNTQL